MPGFEPGVVPVASCRDTIERWWLDSAPYCAKIIQSTKIPFFEAFTTIIFFNNVEYKIFELRIKKCAFKNISDSYIPKKRRLSKGPFINDVTLNWTFFDPPPPSVTLCHKKEDPPLKMMSQIDNPPHPAWSKKGFFFTIFLKC